MLSNLEFRDLKEIDGYRKESLFQKKQRLPTDRCEPIWQQVDLARVLVLDFVLRTTDAERVFYSDFDVALPPLVSAEIAQRIGRHGVVFAKSSRNDRNNCFYLENQFMGIARSQTGFISEHLMPATYSDITEKGNNGWLALCASVRKNFSYIDPTLDAISIRTYEIIGGNSFPVQADNFFGYAETTPLKTPVTTRPEQFGFLNLSLGSKKL